MLSAKRGDKSWHIPGETVSAKRGDVRHAHPLRNLHLPMSQLTDLRDPSRRSAGSSVPLGSDQITKRCLRWKAGD